MSPIPTGQEDKVEWAIQTVLHSFPSEYRSVQRAVITVRKKQFVCDGLMTVSPGQGWDLAIVNTLGLVTKVHVDRSGKGEVREVTPLFRMEWSRDFVVRDLRWLFVPPPELHLAGAGADGELALECSAEQPGVVARYFYSPDGGQWNRVELIKGQRRIYGAVVKQRQAVPGCRMPTPSEIQVDAGVYSLYLRLAQIAVPPSGHQNGETGP